MSIIYRVFTESENTLTCNTKKDKGSRLHTRTAGITQIFNLLHIIFILILYIDRNLSWNVALWHSSADARIIYN